jgi:hypothetical protein
MFPQLVAGPIVRFKDVADQLRERTHTMEKFARGLAFLGLGLGKKILLANPCGKVADMAFDAGSVECLDAWIGAVDGIGKSNVCHCDAASPAYLRLPHSLDIDRKIDDRNMMYTVDASMPLPESSVIHFPVPSILAAPAFK